MDTVPVIDMIIRSGWIARIILFLLFVFSLVSWGIIANRLVVLASVRRLNKKFMHFFNDISSIKTVKDASESLQKSAAGTLGLMGLGELERIIEDAKTHKGVTDWSFYIQNQFIMAQERFAAEVGRLSRKQDWGIYLLAVISSTAPFLGLFGTVWGIMNSFYAIGKDGSASLPVVAPGIAEALVTTIIGLAVAIPAVIFYNVFNHKVERIEDELDEFGDYILLRLKRELFNLLYTNNKKSTAPVAKAPVTTGAEA